MAAALPGSRAGGEFSADERFVKNRNLTKPHNQFSTTAWQIPVHLVRLRAGKAIAAQCRVFPSTELPK
jgi:hypothetical protein